MQQKQEYVNTTRFTSNIAVGGPGGNPFNLFAHYPKVVKRVVFHRDQDWMTGIEFERYDSSIIKLGSCTDKSPVTIEMGEEELVTRMLLYSKLADYHAGKVASNATFAGIKITTNKKTAEAFPYYYTPKDSDQVEIPVGVGKWVGIFGNAGGVIDCLGVGMSTSNG